jgi:hypothetical protein
MIANARLHSLVVAILIVYTFKEITSHSVWLKKHIWKFCVLQRGHISKLVYMYLRKVFCELSGLASALISRTLCAASCKLLNIYINLKIRTGLAQAV